VHFDQPRSLVLNEAAVQGPGGRYSQSERGINLVVALEISKHLSIETEVILR
jgi:hypothetical protein